MKISQSVTSQVITPSSAGLNWAETTDHYWLWIANGLMIIREFDGRLRLLIENKLDRTGRAHFSGSLYNSTSGTISPIFPGDHLSIDLRPEDTYLLVINNIATDPDNGKHSTTTWTMEFSPDRDSQI